MDPLHVGLIGVAACVKGGPAGRLGEVSGQALLVLGVKAGMSERMLRHRVGDTECVPSPAYGEDRVETSEVFVERHARILARRALWWLPCRRV
jgi:hypothetical protein